MPGTLPPAMGASGPWDWLQQMLQSIAKRLHNLENSQTTIVLDQWQNAVVVIGQLDQKVTNGASFGVAGTTAATGFTGVGIITHKSGSWVQIG